MAYGKTFQCSTVCIWDETYNLFFRDPEYKIPVYQFEGPSEKQQKKVYCDAENAIAKSFYDNPSYISSQKMLIGLFHHVLSMPALLYRSQSLNHALANVSFVALVWSIMLYSVPWLFTTHHSLPLGEDTFITDNGASADLSLLAISKQKPNKKASVFSGWSG